MSEPLSFVSQGPPWTIDLRPRGRVTVYPVANPTDVPSRTHLDYLVGQIVLIDGVARRVYGVESYCIGGVYPAGKGIGLAIKEDEI